MKTKSTAKAVRAGLATRREAGIANRQSPIANPDKIVARAVIVPEAKIKPGQKLVVVLATKNEMAAVHKFLLFAPEVEVPKAITAELVPMLQGIARSWLIG